jgi:hypothetical protein
MALTIFTIRLLNYTSKIGRVSFKRRPREANEAAHELARVYLFRIKIRVIGSMNPFILFSVSS